MPLTCGTAWRTPCVSCTGRDARVRGLHAKVRPSVRRSTQPRHECRPCARSTRGRIARLLGPRDVLPGNCSPRAPRMGREPQTSRKPTASARMRSVGSRPIEVHRARLVQRASRLFPKGFHRWPFARSRVPIHHGLPLHLATVLARQRGGGSTRSGTSSYRLRRQLRSRCLSETQRPLESLHKRR